ncbi:MAG: hypothetical protein HOI07_04405 [Betaproteobacteria bacterium]|jgi:hypothetical protein|nr:hypothetical protein [Betaproteobacteria bacterium]
MNIQDEHLRRSVEKMRVAYKAHEDKKQSRTIVFLKDIPERIVEKRSVSGICQALTMKGNKCSFRAVNGCFCKKHTLKDSEKVIGTKRIIL